MTVLPLIPERLPNGMIVEVRHGDSEIGGFEAVLWRDARRAEGLMFPELSDLRAVRECIAKAMEVMNGR